jgi:hypothetical protein
MQDNAMNFSLFYYIRSHDVPFVRSICRASIQFLDILRLRPTTLALIKRRCIYMCLMALLTGARCVHKTEIGVLKKTALFKRQTSFIPIIVVFCLALLLVRLVYNLTVVRGYMAIYDAGLYDIIGHNLATLHCYCLYPPLPDVSRPPLWPFILAGIDLFSGKNEFYLRLFYCFLGSGTCVLIYLFARDLFGTRIALITGLIAAIYTGLFIWDGWLYIESLYDFCLIAFAYSLFHLLFLWAVIVAYTKIVPLRVAMQNALIIACIGMLILAPWTYRNYAVTGRFLLVSTGLGEVLKGAYSTPVVSGRPDLRGMWRAPSNEGLPFFMLAALGLLLTWRRRKKELLVVYPRDCVYHGAQYRFLQQHAFSRSPRTISGFACRRILVEAERFEKSLSMTRKNARSRRRS